MSDDVVIDMAVEYLRNHQEELRRHGFCDDIDTIIEGLWDIKEKYEL